MNIFYLDHDVQKCAEYHVDKHVVKMVTEYAQLLSAAHHLNGQSGRGVMKMSHKGHPCTLFTARTSGNYAYVFSLYKAVANEYTRRYGKIHKSWHNYHQALSLNPCPTGTMGKLPQCMPDDCKQESTLEAYRQYYIKHKSDLHSWSGRDTPPFIKD